MAKIRTVWYEKHGISRMRYQELVLICRRYPEYRAEDLRIRRGEIDRREGGNETARGTPDPTGNRAVRWADSRPRRKMRAIERAAEEACGCFARMMLDHVTAGRPVEAIAPPCGNRAFYQMRREFFVRLDALWEE